MVVLLLAGGCGSDPPEPQPLTLINLGDSLTNGVQSATVNELTQSRGYAQLLAGQLAQVRPLSWSNPLLDPSTGARLQPDLIPHNLGVASATARSLAAETSGGGNLLLDRLLAPIPEQAGRPLSQLEAARFLAAQQSGRRVLFTLWIGNNDVLGAVAGGNGAALTRTQIEAFLADTGAGHDLTQVEANLSLIVQTLREVPDSHLFLANLPDVTQIGFLLGRQDLATLAGVPAAELAALPEGSALGFGPFLVGVAPTLAAGPAVLNAAVAAVAGLDGNLLDPAEAALVQARIAAINAHLASLAAAPGVTLVDAQATFDALVQGEILVAGRALGKTFGAGGLFSLDGIHPSHTGHALIANLFIGAMNEALELGIPPLDLAAVQAADPYLDRDGDGFPAGPGALAVAPALLPLADCDDTHPGILPPVVAGLPACP